jgi:hypothetical protein
VRDAGPRQAHAPETAWPWKRYLKIAVPALVLLALAIFLFWPALQVRLWISSLHADDPRAIAAARDNLIASQREGLDDTLEGILRDPGESFAVRTLVGEILLKRNRLQRVEAALLSDRLEERTAALAVLQQQRFFADTYPGDPRYRIQETVLQWIDREGDPTRGTAVRLAKDVGVPEALPKIRGLIHRSASGALSRDEETLLKEALGAVKGFKDCESLSQVLDVALNEKNDDVRRVALSVLVRATRQPEPYCADALPEETVKLAVLKGLEGGRITQIMAMLVLSQESAWAREAYARLLTILDSGEDGVLRRHALNALTNSGAEDLVARLPRYFSDENPSVRSEAVTAAQVFGGGKTPKARFEGCLIGIVANERENRAAWDAALRFLRERAGGWQGLPAGIEAGSSEAGRTLMTFLTDMFERGESHDLSRADWAKAWFRWWAADLGLTPEQVDAAVATRDAFWSAARAGDVTGARRVLQAFQPAGRGLFSYEEGWLAGRA